MQYEIFDGDKGYLGRDTGSLTYRTANGVKSNEVIMCRATANWSGQRAYGAKCAKWIVVSVFAAAALMLLSGCATVQSAKNNLTEDMEIVANRIHVDVQEVINHPERLPQAIDYLCDDAKMITADKCVQLKAVIHLRAILTGQQQ